MMNPLNLFTRQNILDIFEKFKKRKPIFLQEKKPLSSEEKPYVWFQILDTVEIEQDVFDTESVLLDTIEYTPDYKFNLAFFDETPSMSITNAVETEKELEDDDDILIEVL